MFHVHSPTTFTLNSITSPSQSEPRVAMQVRVPESTECREPRPTKRLNRSHPRHNYYIICIHSPTTFISMVALPVSEPRVAMQVRVPESTDSRELRPTTWFWFCHVPILIKQPVQVDDHSGMSLAHYLLSPDR